uniref:Predicted protein n=1 Tax=Hordeum vulgare subsp. vulgare TaxID=112509 RepID=F2CXR6_HORVV|nr:predicted protein [Hordeum vulgare subsp. vulgare]
MDLGREAPPMDLMPSSFFLSLCHLASPCFPLRISRTRDARATAAGHQGPDLDRPGRLQSGPRRPRSARMTPRRCCRIARASRLVFISSLL